MAVGLTFFESIFLNKEFKEKKIKKYEEEHGEIQKYEVLDSSEFIKDYDPAELKNDEPITEDVVTEDVVNEDTSVDLDESITEYKDGIILLDKTYDESLYEEDDDDNFDDIGNTKVFMNSLSKTLKFKSNINFDDYIEDVEDKNVEDFEDIDLGIDFNIDEENDEISSELDADEIMNIFDKKLESMLNSVEIETLDTEDSEEFSEKEINSDELMSIIDKRLESMPELSEETSSTEAITESNDFDLSNGIMHFDLDDQLDITDLEGSTLFNSSFNEAKIESEEVTFGFSDDYEEVETITNSENEEETNFPVLESLSSPASEDNILSKSDDDEINIPLL